MTTFTRGDFLAKNGVAVITDSLTFVGTGGLDPTAVDGMIVPFTFNSTLNGTQTGKVMLFSGASTLTQPVAFKDGSVVGLGIRLSTAMTATDKNITIKAFKNTTDTTVHVTLTGTARGGYTAVAKDSTAAAMFSAGDVLSCKLVCSTIATNFSVAAVLYTEQ